MRWMDDVKQLAGLNGKQVAKNRNSWQKCVRPMFRNGPIMMMIEIETKKEQLLDRGFETLHLLTK